MTIPSPAGVDVGSALIPRLALHAAVSDFLATIPRTTLDFMYYAFVVGMTSQVSDVVVTGRPMRRTTLILGVLSFMFNVAIVAMSVNIISGAL